jgi:subtilisin family serine protease
MAYLPLHPSRKKAVWGSRRTLASVTLAVATIAPNAMAAGTHTIQPLHAKPGVPGSAATNYKVDNELTRRMKRGNTTHVSSVIVTLVPGAPLPAQFKRFARAGKLDIINGQVLDLPDTVIAKLAAHPNIFRVHENRSVKSHNYRTGITVGARTVHQSLGYTGAGIGVAVIDSGVATWHDDLISNTSNIYPYGNQRVSKFVDFVNGRTQPYDDAGHGTHVAGIILGNGYDSLGNKEGIAPGASLVSLKVLDANGDGTISHVIAALNWVAQNYKAYNIRVVNLSVGAPIHESYWTDPLTLAAKKVADLGITVVAAAGNLGKNAAGEPQWGGITAPGNAPWVLTVGASSTMGTQARVDDTMASFSSRGPTYVDYSAKPDVVAPGVGTVSLSAPGSTFYITKAPYLLNGALQLGYKPYLSLSGTSMAAPVVSGTIALMLQANPNLTPNLIKAILQYTAQKYPGYSALQEGGGFLNSLGAVRLARFYALNRPGTRMPVQRIWGREIIWGNHRIGHGYLNPLANAWKTAVTWGAVKTDSNDNVIWGTMCGDDACDNIVWGTADAAGDNVVWGTDSNDNVVWGTACGDDACDNVIWGTDAGSDNVVWGTDCGGNDCDNVVWGTADALDNVVWGTADAFDNVVWGTSADPAEMWGSSADADVTWGSNHETDATVYPDDAAQPLPSVDLEFGDLVPLVADPSLATDAGTTSRSAGVL